MERLLRRAGSPHHARMRNLLAGLGLAALLALPARGLAQVHVGIDLGITFAEPPPLVVVSPGIQIVPEYDQEVYFANGCYWARRDEGWYRTWDWRGGWAPVRPAYVPASLARIPPGRFRHYYRDDDGMWRAHREEEWRTWHARHSFDERRDWWRQHRHDHEVRMEQERAWREHDRAWKEEERAERERRHEARHDHDAWRGESRPARYEGRPDDRRAPPPAPERGHDRAPDGGHGHDHDRDHR
jgi:hypothetical protein